MGFLSLLLVWACSQPREWNEMQRAEFMASLDDYREMIYLNDLTDAEFVVFTGDLSSDVEEAYPVYTQFVVMPSLSDTIDMWVVTSIVDDIDADATNMRHLYPYRNLVMQGVLPVGLDHAERMNFYACFAQKVDAQFDSLEAFFYAVITNSIDPNVITKMQNECASELFAFPDDTITQECNNNSKYMSHMADNGF